MTKSVMSLPANSRNMCSNMFLVFGLLISACSAKSPLPDISPLYPFNGGNSFKPTPFAPANDQAWINMMWWKSLAGKPVESVPGRVDPYDDGPHSFNQYLLDRLTEGTVPGITPGAYQKWTQYSNPAADYIGYGLFSNPLGHKSNLPPLGSTLFQPGNDLFWLMQFLQAQHRTPGGPIENNLLNQYNYLLNSQAPLKVDPYANYWAFKNSLRKRRSVDGEENDEDEDDNVAVEEMVKASAMEDEEAAAEAEAQDAAEAQEAAEEQDAAEEEEANINDVYPDILRSYRAYLGADPTHEEEEEESRLHSRPRCPSQEVWQDEGSRVGRPCQDKQPQGAAPYDEDWFYVRCASMARHMYIRSPVGVSTIRKIYGIRSNNGSSPSHWARGNGGVARKALQALEALKLAEKDPNGGRRLTSQGRRDLDRIAAQIKAKKAEALAAQASAVIATA